MHRMASVNEYSTRYTEAIDARQETHPDAWRLQTTKNKQGSAGTLTEWPPGWGVYLDIDEWRLKTPPDFPYADAYIPASEVENLVGSDRPPTPGEVLTLLEKFHHKASQEVYETRLALGVAREQARKDLPLSTYTEAYWKCDLHNTLHFLGLRMDLHAQKEIRDFATVIGEQIIAKLFPIVWGAFLDYRVGATTLSALDKRVLRVLIGGGDGMPLDAVPDYTWGGWGDWAGKPRCREREECIEKFQRLGIFPNT